MIKKGFEVYKENGEQKIRPITCKVFGQMADGTRCWYNIEENLDDKCGWYSMSYYNMKDDNGNNHKVALFFFEGN